MRLRSASTVAVVGVLAVLLVAVSAVGDLRSPSGTERLARDLADDRAVQRLLAEVVVDTLMDDLVGYSPLVALAGPAVRPMLTAAAESTLASPSGRAAVAATLTDVLGQLTMRGPIVVDLDAAALAAADAAPPPLDTLARVAVEQGGIGRVVLGADGDGTPDGPAGPAVAGRVAGLPADVALGVVAVLLVAAVAAAAIAGPAGRRERLLGIGAALATVGTLAALTVRLAPDRIVARIVSAPDVTGTLLSEVVPTLVAGLANLLGRTETLATALAVAGAVLLVVGLRTRLESGHAVHDRRTLR